MFDAKQERNQVFGGDSGFVGFGKEQIRILWGFGEIENKIKINEDYLGFILW